MHCLWAFCTDQFQTHCLWAFCARIWTISKHIVFGNYLQNDSNRLSLDADQFKTHFFKYFVHESNRPVKYIRTESKQNVLGLFVHEFISRTNRQGLIEIILYFAFLFTNQISCQLDMDRLKIYHLWVFCVWIQNLSIRYGPIQNKLSLCFWHTNPNACQLDMGPFRIYCSCVFCTRIQTPVKISC